MKFNSILEAIGNTPHIRLSRLFGNEHNIWMKLERQNPGGSIKDRIALAMIEDAEKTGKLTKDSIIIEPTSGNTGIGLAMVAAVKGYPITLVMPEHMSIERRRIMAAYGANFELTPREKGMPGAIAKATEMVANNPKAWMPQQFENPANIQVHIDTTSEEIAKDFPDGLDYIITGVGTGGHISGCAEALKKKFPNLKVFAVEPEGSPVLSGGKPGPHPLQGIGAGFIPKNCKTELLDGIITVGKDEAFAMAVEIAKKEGIFIGASSGASLAAVAKKLKELPAGSKVLTFCYDTGERYLSVDGLFV